MGYQKSSVLVDSPPPGRTAPPNSSCMSGRAGCPEKAVAIVEKVREALPRPQVLHLPCGNHVHTVGPGFSSAFSTPKQSEPCKSFAVLTSCAMMLSLAASKESLKWKNQRDSSTAHGCRLSGTRPLSCRMPSMTSSGKQGLSHHRQPAEAVTHEAQILFLYQSGAVYNRVLELQARQTINYALYWHSNLCAITSIQPILGRECPGRLRRI